jgi:hypothetical protein
MVIGTVLDFWQHCNQLCLPFVVFSFGRMTFSNSESLSTHTRINIKCNSFVFVLPNTKNITFQSDTQQNYQGSENHVHNHLARTFLAAILLTCEVWSHLFILKDLVSTSKAQSFWISEYAGGSSAKLFSLADLVYSRNVCTWTKDKVQETECVARGLWTHKERVSSVKTHRSIFPISDTKAERLLKWINMKISLSLGYLCVWLMFPYHLSIPSHHVPSPVPWGLGDCEKD